MGTPDDGEHGEAAACIEATTWRGVGQVPGLLQPSLPWAHTAPCTHRTHDATHRVHMQAAFPCSQRRMRQRRQRRCLGGLHEQAGSSGHSTC